MFNIALGTEGKFSISCYYYFQVGNGFLVFLLGFQLVIQKSHCFHLQATLLDFKYRKSESWNGLQRAVHWGLGV